MKQKAQLARNAENIVYKLALLHLKGAIGWSNSHFHADDSTEIMDTEFADGGENMR